MFRKIWNALRHIHHNPRQRPKVVQGVKGQQKQGKQRPRHEGQKHIPKIGTDDITKENAIFGATMIDSHLGDEIPYALIGGVACILLGSTRGTRDFDIVVPNGYRDQARAQLVRNPHVFGSSRTLRSCWIKLDDGNYNVDILEPRQIGQENLQQDKILIIDGCRVLDPSLLLLYERVSYEERSQGTNQDVKKDNDAEDIGFLVEYLGRQGDNVETNDDEIMEMAEGE